MVANGVFSSKIVNMIQLWGGTSDFLLKSIQKLQTKCAKTITRTSWYTATRVVLKKCNWLSIKQLVYYHTLLSTHKAIYSGYPKYICDKFANNHSHNTRSTIHFDDHFTGKSALCSKSFCYRGAVEYDKLPIEIKRTQCSITFKRKLKIWILQNIAID